MRGTVRDHATGAVLAISFDGKTDIDPAAVAAALPRFIASGHADADDGEPAIPQHGAGP